MFATVCNHFNNANIKNIGEFFCNIGPEGQVNVNDKYQEIQHNTTWKWKIFRNEFLNVFQWKIE